MKFVLGRMGVQVANCTDNCLASILILIKTIRYIVIFFILSPPQKKFTNKLLLLPLPKPHTPPPPWLSLHPPLDWLHIPSVPVSLLTPYWTSLLASGFRRGIESWKALSVIAPYAFLLHYSRDSTQTRFYWAVPKLAAGNECSNCLTINSYFAASFWAVT